MAFNPEAPQEGSADLLREGAEERHPNYTDFRVETYVGHDVTDVKFNVKEDEGEEIVEEDTGTNLPDHVEHIALIAKRK